MKKSAPLISVIMPVFNSERYLHSSIPSILNQSFRDFEFIIVNDGSSDKSKFIIDLYKKKDKRITLINQKNKGLVQSLNSAISKAKGIWIARMDADDISTPNRFHSQIDWIKKNNLDICGSWVKRFGRYDRRIVRLPVTNQEIRFQLLFSSPLAHPSIIIRSSLLKNNKYNENFTTAEDYELWLRLSNSNIKYGNVPEVLLFYRVHTNQISTLKINNQIRITNRLKINYWKNYSFKINFNKLCVINFFNNKFLKINNNVLKNLQHFTKNFDISEQELLKIKINNLFTIRAINYKKSLFEYYVVCRFLNLKLQFLSLFKIILVTLFVFPFSQKVIRAFYNFFFYRK